MCAELTNSPGSFVKDVSVMFLEVGGYEDL